MLRKSATGQVESDGKPLRSEWNRKNGRSGGPSPAAPS